MRGDRDTDGGGIRRALMLLAIHSLSLYPPSLPPPLSLPFSLSLSLSLSYTYIYIHLLFLSFLHAINKILCSHEYRAKLIDILFYIILLINILNTISPLCNTIPPGTSRKHKLPAQPRLQILNTLKDTRLVQSES